MSFGGWRPSQDVGGERVRECARVAVSTCVYAFVYPCVLCIRVHVYDKGEREGGKELAWLTGG